MAEEADGDQRGQNGESQDGDGSIGLKDPGEFDR